MTELRSLTLASRVAPGAIALVVVAAVVAGAGCVWVPKRKPDPLDRITGTEDWKAGRSAGADLDEAWQAWYQGRVAWRAALREVRRQRARSERLAASRRRAILLDEEARRRAAVLDQARPFSSGKPRKPAKPVRREPESDDVLFDTPPERDEPNGSADQSWHRVSPEQLE